MATRVWNTRSAVLRIEIAGRLVGQQQPRRVGDRAGDGDALLLAAGQFAGTMFEALAEAQKSQQLARRGPERPPCARPRMSCGMTTFSSAENSGRRWWNW